MLHLDNHTFIILIIHNTLCVCHSTWFLGFLDFVLYIYIYYVSYPVQYFGDHVNISPYMFHAYP